MSYYPPNAPAAEPSEHQSPWKALLGVITEPGATFRTFQGRVPIWPVYLTLMGLAVVALLLQLPVTLQIAEEAALNAPGATPELAAFTKWVGLISAFIGVLIGPWLAGLFVAALAAFFGQFQEERVSFGTYLGMAGYARIPLALSSLVSGALVLAMGKQAMTMSLSLAVLAPEGSGAFVKTFLASLNPFTLWYYAVLAIGFGAVHRAKPSRGVALVATIYVLGLLLMTGLNAIGSRFAPQM